MITLHHNMKDRSQIPDPPKAARQAGSFLTFSFLEIFCGRLIVSCITKLDTRTMPDTEVFLMFTSSGRSQDYAKVDSAALAEISANTFSARITGAGAGFASGTSSTGSTKAAFLDRLKIPHSSMHVFTCSSSWHWTMILKRCRRHELHLIRPA